MLLVVPNKVNVNFNKLSMWEKIFVINYYKKGLPIGKNKYLKVNEDINKELEKLYSIAEDRANFKIDFSKSEDILKEYQKELNNALENKNIDHVQYLVRNKKRNLYERSIDYSQINYEQYKHIVNIIKYSNYEDAFKVLILHETLTKIYRNEVILGKTVHIVEKREIDKSIAAHMIINDIVLRELYENVLSYSSFSKLYFDALDTMNEIISKKGEFFVEGVNTFNKGHWIRFEGKKSNGDKYLENAKELASLVKDTPWCTKRLAIDHLKEGDFYVFVDKENNPHIAIKLLGDEVDEVRGILNDTAQEIEQEYQDVAIELLSKNRKIKYGEEWFDKVKWNKKASQYLSIIDDIVWDDDSIDELLDFILNANNYKNHSQTKNYREFLLEKVRNSTTITQLLAQKFNCRLDELYVGDINRKSIYGNKFPYKVVLGNLNFPFSKNIDMSSLECILGNAYLFNSLIENIDSLEVIYGDCNIEDSNIKSMNSLRYIAKNCYFANCNIEKLPSIEKIDGILDIEVNSTLDLFLKNKFNEVKKNIK